MREMPSIKRVLFTTLLMLGLMGHAAMAQHFPPVIADDMQRLLPKNLKFEVQRQSGDFEEWGTEWRNTGAQQITFRWSHHSDSTGLVAAYEVREAWSFGSKVPVSTGLLSQVPTKGKLGHFTIDFSGIIGATSPPELSTLEYTVNLGLYHGISVHKPLIKERALPIKVFILSSTGNTPITLPSQPILRVVFDKLTVIDDSDELSDGDLYFAFWAKHSNVQHGYAYYSADMGSGETTNPGITFTIAGWYPNIPEYVEVFVFGFDDDEDSGFNLANYAPPVFYFDPALATCGLLPVPTAPDSGDCPRDRARGGMIVMTEGLQPWPRSFTLYANGPKLRFLVSGRVEYASPD